MASFFGWCFVIWTWVVVHILNSGESWLMGISYTAPVFRWRPSRQRLPCPSRVPAVSQGHGMLPGTWSQRVMAWKWCVAMWWFSENGGDANSWMVYLSLFHRKSQSRMGTGGSIRKAPYCRSQCIWWNVSPTAPTMVRADFLKTSPFWTPWRLSTPFPKGSIHYTL